MIQYNISFAGAGNLGGSLCKAIHKTNYNIDLIVSESEKSGLLLADRCNALWSEKLIFPESTDIILVAVPDHRLKIVLNKIQCPANTLVAHTAGSFGTDVFPDRIGRRGVFYPLQTFSKGRRVNWKNLPVLLEASDNQSLGVLENLAKSIGGKVYFVEEDVRKILHLAAVFACNFTNHMLTLSKRISTRSDIPFEVLKPLINETLSKALDVGPENSQTGPAVRNDLNTIEKHLELLSFEPELQNVYREMTQSIINYYKEE